MFVERRVREIMQQFLELRREDKERLCNFAVISYMDGSSSALLDTIIPGTRVKVLVLRFMEGNSKKTRKNIVAWLSAYRLMGLSTVQPWFGGDPIFGYSLTSLSFLSETLKNRPRPCADAIFQGARMTKYAMRVALGAVPELPFAATPPLLAGYANCKPHLFRNEKAARPPRSRRNPTSIWLVARSNAVAPPLSWYADVTGYVGAELHVPAYHAAPVPNPAQQVYRDLNLRDKDLTQPDWVPGAARAMRSRLGLFSEQFTDDVIYDALLNPEQPFIDPDNHAMPGDRLRAEMLAELPDWLTDEDVEKANGRSADFVRLSRVSGISAFPAEKLSFSSPHFSYNFLSNRIGNARRQS